MCAYLGSWKVDDLLTFYAQTQVFATGVATDADAVPAYRIYENSTDTPLTTGTLALLDATNTAGLYSGSTTLTAALGFEKGKSYAVHTAATVSGVAGAKVDWFQIEAEVDAHRLNWANVDNPTTAVNLSATNIDVDQVVASVSGAVGSVTGAVGSVTGAVGSVTGAVGSVTGNVGGNVVGTVASVTGNVGGNVVGSVASVVGAVGSVTGAVGSVTGAVGSVTGAVGSVTAAVTTGELTPTARAEIKTDAVIAAFTTDTYAELAAVPTATSPIFTMIRWLFALGRNKRTSTLTTELLRNDADAGTIATSTHSDDGTTAIRGEWT